MGIFSRSKGFDLETISDPKKKSSVDSSEDGEKYMTSMHFFFETLEMFLSLFLPSGMKVCRMLKRSARISITQK